MILTWIQIHWVLRVHLGVPALVIWPWPNNSKRLGAKFGPGVPNFLGTFFIPISRWYIWEVGSVYNMSMWHYCATLLKSTLLNKTGSASSEILAKWSQGYISWLLLKNHVPICTINVCPIGLKNVMRKNALYQCEVGTLKVLWSVEIIPITIFRFKLRTESASRC